VSMLNAAMLIIAFDDSLTRIQKSYSQFFGKSKFVKLTFIPGKSWRRNLALWGKHDFEFMRKNIIRSHIFVSEAKIKFIFCFPM
ncbi:hypothetical protein L9F63_010828, partial [Diploptera punctata]